MPFALPRALAALTLLAGLSAALPAWAAVETPAREALLIDTRTGAVLLEKNAHDRMPPASMSKLMTVYMVMDELKEGRLSLDDTLPVSENAWEKGGFKSGSSTMALEPNTRVRVEDLLRGIIVQSGNDACIVAAEALSGSETAFAQAMTIRARELGLTDSTFRNATGWPDPEHRMTAWDLAALARRTIADHADYYHYYAEKTFTYNGIKQQNRNPLLYKDMGADGLKTGHTQESGYGLVGTVERDGRRLILVVNGLDSKKERASESERLLEWGFREFQNYDLFKAGETVTDAEVWLGDQATVPLVIEKDLTLTLKRRARRTMNVVVRYDQPIPAPFVKGDRLATLVISGKDMEPVEVPLVAGADVAQLGFVGRIGAALKYIVWGASSQ
ncbi:MAG: D-alanyl-D-alanine carboxypeptidase [Rhodobacterales bacterium]|nr:D-alanyl-D-alanine carboxypeptidase [Rhodobacterales bacterium]